MPQPQAVHDLADPLVEAYRNAWDRIQSQLDLLQTDPLAFRRRTRLVEMRRTVEAMMDELDSEAKKWISSRVPQIYSAGAGAAASSDSAFTQINQEAVKRLSRELFDELLAATDGVRDSTKSLIRQVARDEALQKAIEGRTAKQAATEMRRVLEDNAVHAVTYANGTRHGLAEYSEMAMRTTTAKAYNSGTLGSAPEVKFFEIFDGPNCGLSFHEDPTTALGLVVDRQTAEKYLISHPNCRRSFGPRPDITTAKQAKDAAASTTPGQRVAQLEQDAARGDREARAALRGQTREDRLAARQAKIEARQASRVPPDQFPEFKKLPAPESYKEALHNVNPGSGTSYRNNCHYVAPSMEMRARGYDVVASQTFKDEGRFHHSIEKDWIDPATGEARKFQYAVPKVNALVKGSAPDFEAGVLERTADWPPGARGFIQGDWKTGGAHIWNLYKDDNGVLHYVDGQVAKVQVKSYLQRVNRLRVMRVDDLEPVRERLLQAATTEKLAVDKVHQVQAGIALYRQIIQDFGTSGALSSAYQSQLFRLEEKLRRLGVTYEELRGP